MNAYIYLNNQISDHFITTFIAHSETISQRLLKNIQQEHRFRTLNTLTVNEHTAENEIVPLQRYSLSCADTFHFYSLR